jgi:hypothetical protein
LILNSKQNRAVPVTPFAVTRSHGVEKSDATKQITLSAVVQGAAKRRTLDQVARDRFFDVNLTRSASPTTVTAKVQSGDGHQAPEFVIKGIEYNSGLGTNRTKPRGAIDRNKLEVDEEEEQRYAAASRVEGRPSLTPRYVSF